MGVGVIVLVGCEVEGRSGVDVRIAGGRIVAVGALEPRPGDEPLATGGGALLPGLHDHHIHLRALAARAGSVRLGPADVQDSNGLIRALHAAARHQRAPGWIRAVGYHESVAGPLDAARLDAIVADRPVRVQHRTGALWTLNTAGLRAVGADAARDGGIERDATGRPTGRLWRLDRWLAARTPAAPADFGWVGRRAAERGVTGFTDADPERTPADVAGLHAALDDGRLPQRIHLMGPAGLRVPAHPRLTLGPVKILLDDATLPSLGELEAIIAAAHAEGRPAAIHCVTRLQVVLALAAFAAAGRHHGDRIEHGSVIPADLLPEVARLGITVVTQPGFVAERGDQYRTDVEAGDLPHLYRCRSLLDAGIPVALSTDAPFTDPDPWRAVAAATSRRTIGGHVLDPGERIDARTALRLLTGTGARPGTATIEVGQPADLCLLATPMAEAVADPTSAQVRATLVAGQLVA